IFRNSRTINLAQGDFSMIGAFVALVILERSGGSLVVATLVTIVAVTVLAVVVERLIMRPIEGSDWLTLFTATLGVFYILHGVAGWIWGRDTKSFPALFSSAPLSIGGTLISQAHLFNILVAAVVGGILYLFFRFTKPGIAMRAITEDPVAAQLMGIPVRSIVLLTWAVGGVLAAISGILLAPLVYVSTQMMDGVLVKGYVGAVFGGLYSLPGAVIGIAAYPTALMAKHLGTSVVPGLVAGTVLAGIVGFGLGIICLRLGGAFLAIATLGFALAVGAVLNNWSIFEGREGIQLGKNSVAGLGIKDVGFY